MHRFGLLLLALHVPVIVATAGMRGYGWSHGVLEGLVPAGCAIVAGWAWPTRFERAAPLTVGLFASSATLTHLLGGSTLLVVHFVLAIAFLVAYAVPGAWLVALGFAVFEHAVLGVLDPHSIYGHDTTTAAKVTLILVHGAILLGGAVLSWRLARRATPSVRQGP
ncbi:MAG: hypothetical protein HYT80_06290 [Euryarchaeota archaeon]|nr:hypothetical protein [Euryarchaeota archaeon]